MLSSFFLLPASLGRFIIRRAAASGRLLSPPLSTPYLTCAASSISSSTVLLSGLCIDELMVSLPGLAGASLIFPMIVDLLAAFA